MVTLFKRRLMGVVFIVCALAVFRVTAVAQPQSEQGQAKTGAADQPDPNSEASSMEMREMARAMKSMADMCQMMMQQEMQRKPLMMVALGVVGTLLTIALILFVVLEIQWIRFWSVRLKTEKRKLENTSI